MPLKERKRQKYTVRLLSPSFPSVCARVVPLDTLLLLLLFLFSSPFTICFRLVPGETLLVDNTAIMTRNAIFPSYHPFRETRTGTRACERDEEVAIVISDSAAELSVRVNRRVYRREDKGREVKRNFS